ncbi:host cell division inhibitor Icd-like protein [Leclercia pneumoniae]|uniref:host cell division inhibitor Icd-like protein n=1 Tax=Leclercia pneumoniae TaxID=2815358 RepID=UPI002DBF4965|nr:host cell division inhibitor Icd-like protein [Leclercia pneumoniae]MEB7501760.1 host cell division inhibitor Icd-like protein [Leclercia pneumoniae]
MMMATPQKASFSGLLPFLVSRYSFPAVAKSTAGRENPSLTMATPDAPCVFFCVCASVHPFIGQRFFDCCAVKIMVAQAGQLSGWPVYIVTGFSPLSGLPPLRENFGGSCNKLTMEVALMATTLTLSHPQFIFVFVAVRREDCASPVCMLRTVAGDESAARLTLVRDYILCFAGRLPVHGVRA